MNQSTTGYPLLAAALTIALSAPSGVFAYGTDDAIRHCEKRLKDEYRSVSESDIFVTAKHQNEANVEWRIETDKLNDWGTCQVSPDDQVIAVRTKQHQTK